MKPDPYIRPPLKGEAVTQVSTGGLWDEMANLSLNRTDHRRRRRAVRSRIPMLANCHINPKGIG
jgi:hypothetical protein